jgi:YesN/AraC family two-component response regulator
LKTKDGERGIALSCGEQPDLVVADIIMHEQEGQAINEIRSAKPDAKIIAVSGSGRFCNTDFVARARRLAPRVPSKNPSIPMKLG